MLFSSPVPPRKTRPHERSALLDAGLVRAHAVTDDADAERRAGVARRQRRIRTTASPIADLVLAQRDVARHRRAARSLEHEPDVVGLSVMTFQRKTRAARSSRSSARSRPAVTVVVGGYDPSLAPEAYDRRRLRRRRHRARRRRAHVPRVAARARERGGRSGPCRGCRYRRRRRGSSHTPARHVSHLGGRGRAAQSRRARADRLHLARPADRHRRDLARLHVRLQLLFDHRDARPQLPHVVASTACSPTSPTRAVAARARSSSSTTTSR